MLYYWCALLVAFNRAVSMVRVMMVVWFGVSTNVYVVVVLQHEGELLLNVETTAFHLQCKLFSIRIFEYIKCFFLHLIRVLFVPF